MRAREPGVSQIEQEGFSLSRETLRRLLRTSGIGSPRKRRSPAHRQRRLRTGREGPPRLEEMSLEEVEALLIKKALARFSGNVSHAANALGLSRSALYRRLQRYGL